MAFGSRTVAQRDVQFNVNLGQFRAELGEAQNIYARSTGQMSTEALRLSVAEERVARAIKAHGAESLQARSATVALRKETESLTAASLVSRDALLSEEHAIGRATRGAIAGSGAFRGMGRSIAFSSAAFLGAAGLVYALRASLKAAEAHQVSLGQLQNALHNTGLSWRQYGADIQASLDAQVKSTAFTNDELTTSLALFVRRYGDVNLALKANALAADVARGKNESLAEAQKQVIAAGLGNTRAARQLDIAPVQKVTAAVEALRATTKHATADQLANAKAADQQATATKTLAAIDAAYHGSAAKYLTTSAGKQALFAAELKLTEEIIGTALLPELNHLLESMAKYLEKLNRSGKLQHDVKVIAHDLGLAFHGVHDALVIVKDILDPVNQALGGLKHSVELLTLALIAFKLRGVAAFVRGTKEVEVAAAEQATAVEAAATAETAAVETAVAAETAAAAGAGGALAGASLRGVLGGALVLGAPLLALNALQGKELPAYTDPKTGEQVTVDPKTGQFYVGYPGKPRAKISSDTKLAQAALAYYIAHGELKPPNTSGMSNDPLHDAASRSRGGRRGAGGTPPRPGTGTILQFTLPQKYVLEQAKAAAGYGSQAQADRDVIAYVLGQIRSGRLSPVALADAYNALGSAKSDLASIDATAHSKTDTAKRKAAEARKRAAARAAAEQKQDEREAALKRRKLIQGLEQAPLSLRIAVETALANNASEDRLLTLYRKERDAIEKQVIELRKIGAGKDAILRARTSEAAVEKHILAITKKKKTPADLASLEREFLDTQRGLYGGASNVFTQDAKGHRSPGSTVVVNQNFNAPPTTDRHREARFARHAMLAAFDS